MVWKGVFENLQVKSKLFISSLIMPFQNFIGNFGKVFFIFISLFMLAYAVSIHTTEILALKIFHVVDKQCRISKNYLPHRQCNALLKNTGSMEQIKSSWALFNLMVHHKNKQALVTESTHFSPANVYEVNGFSFHGDLTYQWKQQRESLKQIRCK